MNLLNRIFLFLIGTLAVFAALFIVVYTHLTPADSSLPPNVVGRIIESDSETSMIPVGKGDINKGTICLLKGKVKIRLLSGAMVTLYSPAEVIFSSPEEIFLRFGRCVIETSEQPAAFKCRTPEVKIAGSQSRYGLVVHEKQTKFFYIDGCLPTLSLANSGNSVPIKDGTYSIDESGTIKIVNETWENASSDSFHNKKSPSSEDKETK
ncbi:MAG TPA: hypothetical protein PKY88_00790 [Anaerohalosphaeraceae bacterium]|nr:hypothetical protein [Anaerohalosphaeraceae bacterium]